MEIVTIKYKTYEVVESNKEATKYRIIGLMSAKKFDKKYGDRQILSIHNFDDTKTTSIIIWNEELER
jgi:hypothetical protein